MSYKIIIAELNTYTVQAEVRFQRDAFVLTFYNILLLYGPSPCKLIQVPSTAKTIPNSTKI